VIVWGLIETELQEAVELFVSRDEAEAALAAVLADEPGWEGLVVLEPVRLVGLSWN
jgi:hypothetical protein